MSHRLPLMALALAVTAGALGCGYGFAGTGTNVPKTAHTISIPLFDNHTREKGIEVQFQRALEEEFRRRGLLTVVREGDSDVTLSGSIRRFTTTPVAYSATGEAIEYQGLLQVSLKLTDRTGHVLYSNDDLIETLDFGSVSGIVVTASPHFQEGTIDARDLVNMTNVQISEVRRQTNLTELVSQMASDVYLQAVEAF
jgi:outer membrane lipopolysaccharide assembly protein LptE/RlpB